MLAPESGVGLAKDNFVKDAGQATVELKVSVSLRHEFSIAPAAFRLGFQQALPVLMHRFSISLMMFFTTAKLKLGMLLDKFVELRVGGPDLQTVSAVNTTPAISQFSICYSRRRTPRWTKRRQPESHPKPGNQKREFCREAEATVSEML